MNLAKLKEAEKNFFEIYPGGFKHPEMEKIGKKHKMEKVVTFTQESLAIDKFENAETVLEDMIKIVSRSSMVSLFEKPKFRDFARALNKNEAEQLVNGLKTFLYDNEELGFNLMLEILQKGKLAKWSLISVWAAYFRPEKEVFVKPTTAKGVLKYFDVEGMIYKPAPTYAFYVSYRELINSMKENVDKSLAPNNAAFSGFLMMSMG
jgi:hypothetical protein